MTDIAYRLRNHVKSRLPAQEPAMRNGAWDMMLEGADEIDRLRAAMGRPVAWRVKDFAEGWILCHTEEVANHEAEDTGALIQPLYAINQQSQDISEK